jgi:Ca2+-binding RTX toxin-like protein
MPTQTLGFNLPILQQISITSGPIVSVAQFGAVGDGKKDDTAAIQSALNYIKANGGMLNFEAGHTYVVSKVVTIANAHNFMIDGNGATIKMAAAAPVDWDHAILRVQTSDHFGVTELTLDGNRANRPASSGQVPAHNVDIVGSHDFSFSDVTAVNAVMDGFLVWGVNQADTSTYTRNGLFLNCNADNSFRQGMTIANGENIQVVGGAYTDTHGGPPSAGIDIEADPGTAVPGNDNILIRGVTFSGNDGFGVALVGLGQTANITVEGCYFTNNRDGGINLGTASTLIKGNTFENFSESYRGIIDLPADNFTNSNNVITCNSFNNISTGQPVIYAHAYSGTNNQVYSNDFYNISGAMLVSYTTGTTGWDNEITTSPTYPTTPPEPTPSGSLINGTSGDDQLVATATAETINGFDGIDQVSYLNSLAGVTVKLWNGTGSGGYAEGDTLISIENVSGSHYNDVLEGTDGDNRLDGLEGDDVVRGLGGNDLLTCGLGNNILYGGTGNDLIYGYKGADTLLGEDGNDTLYSDAGNDSLDGGAGADTMAGDAGNDTLDGGPGNDTMAGGAGNDVYLIDSLADQIIESTGGGTDEIRSTVALTKATAYVENYTFLGTTAVNFVGNSSPNQITGAAAADTLNGAGGNDTLDGGAGNDTYVVNNIGDEISETGSDAGDRVQSSVGYTLGAGLEHLTLTGAGAISGTGNALDNAITGNGAANQLLGLAGNDTLDGGGGNDTLTGGGGNDLYLIDGNDHIVESTSSGTDWVMSWQSYTLESNVENMQLLGSRSLAGIGNRLPNHLVGNAGDNSLDGGSANDRIEGGAGNDTIIGGVGNDTLDGGGGGDTFTGGAGNDLYLIDGNDHIVETATGGTDSVMSWQSYTLESNVENLQLLGISSLTGIGNGLPNHLVGNAGDNLLDGGSGNDRIEGVAGNDTIVGGAGSDILVGSDGNDRLDGSSGNEQMTGGAGSDTFVLGSLKANDVISDFQVGIDRLEIHATAVQTADLHIGATTGGALLTYNQGACQVVLTGVDTTGIDPHQLIAANAG